MNTKLIREEDNGKGLMHWWNQTPREVMWKLDKEDFGYENFDDTIRFKSTNVNEETPFGDEYWDGTLVEEHSDYMWETSPYEFGDLLWEIYDKSFKNQISSLKKFRVFTKWVLMGTYLDTEHYDMDTDAMIQQAEVFFLDNLLESLDITSTLDLEEDKLDVVAEKMLDGLLFKIWRDENPRD